MQLEETAGRRVRVGALGPLREPLEIGATGSRVVGTKLFAQHWRRTTPWPV